MAGYREALRRDSSQPVALNNLAFLMARQGGDLEDALRLAEQAGRTRPDAPEINDTLAYLYLRKGMIRSARASLERLASRARGSEKRSIESRLRLIDQGKAGVVIREMEENGPRHETGG